MMINLVKGHIAIKTVASAVVTSLVSTAEEGSAALSMQGHRLASSTIRSVRLQACAERTTSLEQIRHASHWNCMYETGALQSMAGADNCQVLPSSALAVHNIGELIPSD